MRTVLYKRQEFVELSFNPVAIVATHSKERGEPFGHADMAVFTPDGQNVWFTLPIHDRESLQQSYEELSRFEDVIRGLRKSLQNELSASND